jgi:hypothetical protein
MALLMNVARIKIITTGTLIIKTFFGLQVGQDNSKTVRFS